MRLIDQEKLFTTILEGENWDVPDWVYRWIREAPAEDAVPMQFIRNKWLFYKNREEFDEDKKKFREAIEWLIRDWRRTNADE